MISPDKLTSQLEIDELEEELDKAIARCYKETPAGPFVIHLKRLPVFTYAAWYVLKPRYEQHWDVKDEADVDVRPRIVFSMPLKKISLMGDDK